MMWVAWIRLAAWQTLHGSLKNVLTGLRDEETGPKNALGKRLVLAAQ